MSSSSSSWWTGTHRCIMRIASERAAAYIVSVSFGRVLDDCKRNGATPPRVDEAGIAAVADPRSMRLVFGASLVLVVFLLCTIAVAKQHERVDPSTRETYEPWIHIISAYPSIHIYSSSTAYRHGDLPREPHQYSHCAVTINKYIIIHKK